MRKQIFTVEELYTAGEVAEREYFGFYSGEIEVVDGPEDELYIEETVLPWDEGNNDESRTIQDTGLTFGDLLIEEEKYKRKYPHGLPR